jgi:hypothetical protein
VRCELAYRQASCTLKNVNDVKKEFVLSKELLRIGESIGDILSIITSFGELNELLFSSIKILSIK